VDEHERYKHTHITLVVLVGLGTTNSIELQDKVSEYNRCQTQIEFEIAKRPHKHIVAKEENFKWIFKC
jgi:hypothetical protein